MQFPPMIFEHVSKGQIINQKLKVMEDHTKNDGGSPTVTGKTYSPNNIFYDRDRSQAPFIIYHDGHRVGQSARNCLCKKGCNPHQGK